MTEKEIDELIKKVTDVLDYNRKLREDDKKFKPLKKKYKNVPTEPWDVYFVQEM